MKLCVGKNREGEAFCRWGDVATPIWTPLGRLVSYASDAEQREADAPFLYALVAFTALFLYVKWWSALPHKRCTNLVAMWPLGGLAVVTAYVGLALVQLLVIGLPLGLVLLPAIALGVVVCFAANRLMERVVMLMVDAYRGVVSIMSTCDRTLAPDEEDTPDEGDEETPTREPLLTENPKKNETPEDA